MFPPFTGVNILFPPGEADSSLALPDCEELNGVEQFCKNCETELHSSEPDVIQDIARSIFGFIHQCGLILVCL